MIGPTSVLLLALQTLGPGRSTTRSGPHHLTGWTLSNDVPDQGPQPTTLVIAREGHIVRRIEGDSFIWSWSFEARGKQIAYQTGPLHFSLTCVLVDIDTGRTITKIDCFAVDQARLPRWARDLDR